jgi:hypothetical protein
MHLRKTALLAVLAALVLAPTAHANYIVGVSEQNNAMFQQPAWQSLKLKRVRYLVPWDYAKVPFEKTEVANYMAAAHAAKQEVLVAFTARSGCYVNGKYSKSSSCKAPSTSAYKSMFLAFKKSYPWVKTYTPWNEENHVSQPTYNNQKAAAAYYSTIKANCSGCTVLAADVLVDSKVTTWLKTFLKDSKGAGKIWGLHNYPDVNRFRVGGLASALKLLPGQVWLTETGGIVTFDPSFPTSLSRANKAEKYMFQIADKYDSLLKGNKSKVTRLYNYSWYGSEPGARFDSGLVNPDNTPRPAYATFAKYAKARQR